MKLPLVPMPLPAGDDRDHSLADGRLSAQTGASSFSDVADGQYYSDAAMWAAANRIVGGYEDGRFAPMTLSPGNRWPP